jgi:hypothetical protein
MNFSNLFYEYKDKNYKICDGGIFLNLQIFYNHAENEATNKIMLVAPKNCSQNITH